MQVDQTQAANPGVDRPRSASDRRRRAPCLAGGSVSSCASLLGFDTETSLLGAKVISLGPLEGKERNQNQQSTGPAISTQCGIWGV